MPSKVPMVSFYDGTNRLILFFHWSRQLQDLRGIHCVLKIQVFRRRRAISFCIFLSSFICHQFLSYIVTHLSEATATVAGTNLRVSCHCLAVKQSEPKILLKQDETAIYEIQPLGNNVLA